MFQCSNLFESMIIFLSCIAFFSGVISPTNYRTKLTSSVAIPFTFIKPCEARGHSTLKDINQRIHAPPPTRPRLEMHNDTAVGYSTSPFSGKPVIVKTKILTEGGKGSITVLRTKGWVDWEAHCAHWIFQFYCLFTVGNLKFHRPSLSIPSVRLVKICVLSTCDFSLEAKWGWALSLFNGGSVGCFSWVVPVAQLWR